MWVGWDEGEGWRNTHLDGSPSVRVVWILEMPAFPNDKELLGTQEPPY